VEQGINGHAQKIPPLENAVFWDATPLPVIPDVVPSSLILSTLLMEATCFCETSVHTTAARYHIPEYGILHSHRRENLKSYIALTGWAV
jgi:hypothetical protein